VVAAECSDDAASRRPLEEAELEEIGLVDVPDRVRLLTERYRECREPDGPAAELVRDCLEQLTVDALEADLVDLEQLESLARNVECDRSGMPYLGDISDTTQDSIRNARRATGSTRDLVGCGCVDVDVQDLPGGTIDVTRPAR
jgi:hypothetical protein